MSSRLPAFDSLLACSCTDLIFEESRLAPVASSRKWSRCLFLGNLVDIWRPQAPFGRENLLRGRSLPVPRTVVITAKVASSATPLEVTQTYLLVCYWGGTMSIILVV